MHWRLTYVSIKLLLDLIEVNPVFAKIMMRERQQWVWMDAWLKGFIAKKQVIPPLIRQESREQTFTKYQAQVEKMGGTLSLETEDPAPRDELRFDASQLRNHHVVEGYPANFSSRRQNMMMSPLHPSTPSEGAGPNTPLTLVGEEDEEMGQHGPRVPLLQSSSALTAWKCQVCTLDNDAGSYYCAACTGPRPSSRQNPSTLGALVGASGATTSSQSVSSAATESASAVEMPTFGSMLSSASSAAEAVSKQEKTPRGAFPRGSDTEAHAPSPRSSLSGSEGDTRMNQYFPAPSDDVQIRNEMPRQEDDPYGDEVEDLSLIHI